MTSILSRPLFSGLRVKENLPQKESALIPVSKSLQSLTKDTVQFGSAQAFCQTAEVEKNIPINIYTPENPLSATVIRNTVLNPHSPEPDTHEIVFKVGEKLIWEPGQCIKVISNKPNNDNNGPHEAAYSIASHHDPKTNELTLFVKRLKLRDDKGNINYWGRCSNYLCDSKPGDKIKLYGPQNDTLVLPKQPNINVVAICGGTGLAPVRAMLPDRTVSTGSTLVFYGIKNQDNYAYQQELESIALDHPSSIKLFVGFSDKTT
ncbi:MAG: hypothetical protein K2X66_06180, partial [Cyanobacteria bacterium]|nr:hypothetical protein [Cyanobacteriota bacterium]